MEFTSIVVYFAGCEGGVAKKSGKKYRIVRFNEMKTGKQVQFWAWNDELIKQVDNLKPLDKCHLVISLEQSEKSIRVNLLSISKEK